MTSHLSQGKGGVGQCLLGKSILVTVVDDLLRCDAVDHSIQVTCTPVVKDERRTDAESATWFRLGCVLRSCFTHQRVIQPIRNAVGSIITSTQHSKVTGTDSLL